MLCAMHYLCAAYRIPARLAITIHDELRFLVREGHELRAAMALQISNLWVRGLFAEQAGLSDLPFVHRCSVYPLIESVVGGVLLIGRH